MSKFKLTQTATEVQNILNNSLQKPTGLTKTKLVGVGVNGQENIEIGDNLTLANGKLSSATGSLPSTITFDQEGNRTAGKNLEVDGKLKLKSLVSASNPDGDITKELGGGEIHGYRIGGIGTGYYLTYISKNYQYPIGEPQYVSYFGTDDKYKELRTKGVYPAGGYYYNDSYKSKTLLMQVFIDDSGNFKISGYDPVNQSYRNMATFKIPSSPAIYINQLF